MRFPRRRERGGVTIQTTSNMHLIRHFVIGFGATAGGKCRLLLMSLRLATICTESVLAAVKGSIRTTRAPEAWRQPRIWEQTSMDIAWRWLCVGLAGLILFWSGPARGDDSGLRPLDIYFIDVMGGASTLLVTPEQGVDPDRLGLAGIRGSRPQADRSCAQGPGWLRPPGPPGHHALAHGPFRGRRRPGEGLRNQALLGPGAAGG